MNHYASPDFWTCYRALPVAVRTTADKAFALLKSDAKHQSLHLKRVGRYWSARVGLRYRAIGVDVSDGILWIWIGTHASYDKLM